MGRREKCVCEAAAIASHKARICLITTSSGKHWVIPKGRVARGDRPWEAVAQEAWEEAGIVGKAKRRPVGTYSFLKAGRLYKVTVYLMKVTKVKDQWPEKENRQRRWLSFREAIKLIERSALRKIVRSAVGA
ncbi:MAG: NUDIX hydrolase [Thermoguttaceae bacterium]